MTREEIIERWAQIASTVFCADNVVTPQWKERLQEAKDKDAATRDKVVGDYLRAIAEEIVSHTTDEELQQMYDEETEGKEGDE